MSKVSIYTTPSCQYCKQAKEYMKENEIAFNEYDVSEDVDRRQEMVEKSGQMGVPVILIGDQMMVGFEQNKFAEVYDEEKADE